MKPFLLLDVDGPLNPWGAPWFEGAVPATGYRFHDLTPSGGHCYRVALNRTHGRELLDLAEWFELAWATTWQNDANVLIAPLLGLPSDLPFVPLSRPAIFLGRRCWKCDQVAAWVAGRAFAWIDDEVNRASRDWLARVPGIGPHLIRRVDSAAGLSTGDFAALRAFADGLAAVAGSN